MRCPYCGGLDTQVKDSRPTEDSAAIRRRRPKMLFGYPSALSHIARHAPNPSSKRIAIAARFVAA